MNQFWIWNTSSAVCNHVDMLFGPKWPCNWSFLAKFRHQLGSKWRVWIKYLCTIPIPGFVNPLMNQVWFWGASTAVCNHAYMWSGPTQPWSCSFLAKMGVSMVENVDVCLRCHVWFPSYALKSLLVNQFWFWNTSAAVYNHADMLFEPE